MRESFPNVPPPRLGNGVKGHRVETSAPAEAPRPMPKPAKQEAPPLNQTHAGYDETDAKPMPDGRIAVFSKRTGELVEIIEPKQEQAPSQFPTIPKHGTGFERVDPKEQTVMLNTQFLSQQQPNKPPAQKPGLMDRLRSWWRS